MQINKEHVQSRRGQVVTEGGEWGGSHFAETAAHGLRGSNDFHALYPADVARCCL